MKGRKDKKTTHQFLISEVAKQIEIFNAQPPAIKGRIEALIEKGILKRCDDDNNSYEYIS